MCELALPQLPSHHDEPQLDLRVLKSALVDHELLPLAVLVRFFRQPRYLAIRLQFLTHYQVRELEALRALVFHRDHK